MWGYMFGKSTPVKKELPKKAIVELREHILTLGKKRNHLELQMSDQEAIARKHITSNKALAKNALKRKRGYETTLLKIEGQIELLETQLAAIEGANLNLETMKAMKQGASAMRQIHGEYDVDKVEDTMEEIREQVELADEISEAISRPVGTDLVDEDELEEELAAMKEEEEVHKHQEEAVHFPKVSQSQLVSKPVPVTAQAQAQAQSRARASEDEDEEALRALQAEMGL